MNPIESKGAECQVCWEEVDHPPIKLVCTHIFHKSCIQGWLKAHPSPHCPYCRRPIHLSDASKLIPARIVVTHLDPYGYKLYPPSN